jgi:hypothetical protein
MERASRAYDGHPDRNDRGPAGGGMRAFPSSNGKYHRDVDELDYIVPRSGRFFEVRKSHVTVLSHGIDTD